MEIQGEPYVILNCHAPNEEKGQVKLFKDVSGHLNGLDIPPGCNFICAGDSNIILDTRIDSLGGNSKLKRKLIYQLKSIISSYNLVGIWHPDIRKPTLRQFTWRRKTSDK